MIYFMNLISGFFFLLLVRFENRRWTIVLQETNATFGVNWQADCLSKSNKNPIDGILHKKKRRSKNSQKK